MSALSLAQTQPATEALSPRVLTPAQRAAATRAANRNPSGIVAPAKPGKAPVAQVRPDGIELDLHIEQLPGQDVLTLSFRFRKGEDDEPFQHTPPGEVGLPYVRVIAYPVSGDLFGYRETRLGGVNLTAHGVAQALPIMQRLDRHIALMRAETEDDSFAQTVASLAAHLRISRIVHSGGVAKRGAAYVTAFRVSESFLASQPEAEPEVLAEAPSA